MTKISYHTVFVLIFNLYYFSYSLHWSWDLWSGSVWTHVLSCKMKMIH